MFAAYKILLIAFSLSVSGFAYAGESAIDEKHNFFCDKNNLCSAFFEGESVKAKKFCDPSHFSVVWQKMTEKYLFQCHDDTTSEGENKNWVVDLRHNSFFAIDFGRFYDKNALISNSNATIRDSFQARHFCHVPMAARLRASDFVLLIKQPSDEEQNPYCYEPAYLEFSGGRLIVQTNEGELSKRTADYRVRIASASEIAGFKLLLNSLH